MIMSYSAAPAPESSRRSTAVTRKIVDICDSIVGGKSTEAAKESRVRSLHSFIRKCAHLYNFMVFAVLNFLLFYEAGNGDVGISVLLTLAVGLCGAALDEFSQLFVPGRAGQIKDVFIDFTGTCQSCIMLCFIRKLFVKEGRTL